MFYVYSRYIKTGKEDYIGIYATEKEAIEKIASCYKIDYKICQQGEYYYFIKKR